MLLLPELTKTRVEHVESHPVALFCASDRHETLVAVVLWFINLNHAATDLTDLVDLLAALSDDGTNHVVGNVDLLGERGAGHGRAGHRLPMGTSRAMRSARTSGVRLRVGTGSIPASGVTAVGHLGGRVLVALLGMAAVLRRVRLGSHLVGPGIRAAAVIVVPVAVIAAGRLGIVRDHLHAAGDGASGPAAAGRISRGRSPTEPLIQLLEQCAADVVGGNVDGVSHSHHDQRALRGLRETRVGRIEAGAGRLLNLLDASTALADDGADEDVRDKEAKRIRLGVLARGLAQGLVVQSADDQAEGL